MKCVKYHMSNQDNSENKKKKYTRSHSVQTLVLLIKDNFSLPFSGVSSQNINDHFLLTFYRFVRTIFFVCICVCICKDMHAHK